MIDPVALIKWAKNSDVKIHTIVTCYPTKDVRVLFHVNKYEWWQIVEERKQKAKLDNFIQGAMSLNPCPLEWAMMFLSTDIIPKTDKVHIEVYR